MKQRFLVLSMLCFAVFAVAACSDDDKGRTPVKTYKVGDYYDVAGVKGIVYKTEDGGRHGLILSLDETTVQWATEAAASVKTFANDADNGADNMVTIQAIVDWQTKFPAFAWCGAKNTGGVIGWFLPAFEELGDLYDVYVANPVMLNEALTANGGAALVALTAADEYYWSSTENPVIGREGEAAFVKFSDPGSLGFKDKIDVARVRAVREF